MKRLVVALTGAMGTGKTTLTERLHDTHKFETVEGSKLLNVTAVGMGKAALSTRDEYEAFWRERQEVEGKSWLADNILAQDGNRIAHIGLRSKYDFYRIHQAGGIIIALVCNDIDLCLARIDPSNPKNPTTPEEYARHLQLQQSDSDFGSHLSWVTANADIQLDTSLQLSYTYRQLDDVITALAAK